MATSVVSFTKMFVFCFFFNLVPSSEETYFLTTFYDLHFSHHYTHITYSNSNSNNQVTYFLWKILALARIWTRDLPGTKPICYQLSYPGLDQRCSLFVDHIPHLVFLVNLITTTVNKSPVVFLQFIKIKFHFLHSWNLNYINFPSAKLTEWIFPITQKTFRNKMTFLLLPIQSEQFGKITR